MRSPATELSLQACLDRHRRSGGKGSLAVVDTVDSTNRLARRIARVYLESDRLVPSLILLARGQTDGRGRRGHTWSSPAGQGIYTSLLLSVADAEALTALPVRVPVALCQALGDLGVTCGIKWPNDLVAGGGKLGGVLIEALAARGRSLDGRVASAMGPDARRRAAGDAVPSSRGGLQGRRSRPRPQPGSGEPGKNVADGPMPPATRKPLPRDHPDFYRGLLAAPRAVIVGYGINGTQEEAALPTPEATSLRLVSGVAPDLSRLAIDLATAVSDRLDESDSMATSVEAYRGCSVHRPGDRLSVRLDGERVAGRFVGFDEHGRLCLDTGDGLRVLSSVDLLTEEPGGDATDDAVGPGA